MLDGLLNAFLLLLEWPHPLLIVGAAIFGFTMGILPGLGGAIVMVLLLPLTTDMSPASAVIVLMAGYGVVGTGGMVTSVVLNTPGTPENAATTLDGYPLSRAGRAPEALGAGAAASTMGALVGLVVLLAIIPFARPLVLALSYPDFLMLAALGLSLIAVITRGQAYRALISAAAGLMVTFIGLDPVVGRPRFTFGSMELWDGIPLVPALIGLFAGAELISLYSAGKSISPSGDDAGSYGTSELALPAGEKSTFSRGFFSTLRQPAAWTRGGLIGTVIGIVPAVGGVVASFLSYAQAAKLSKRPDLFGRGSLEGVVAAESANDAKEAGALVPTLAFGIPGSIGTAIVLAALLFHGIPAGPSLMRDNIDIIYVLLAAMVASKLLCPIFVWAVGTRVSWFSRIRIEILVPIIAVMLFAGTYAASSSLFHIALMLIFGYVGYGLNAYGFSRIAFVIAFVLGPLVESSYHQTRLTFGSIAEGLQRPIAASLFVLTLLVLGSPVITAARSRRRARSSGQVTGRDADPGAEGVLDPGKPTRIGRGGLLFEFLLLGAAAILVYLSVTDLRGQAALVPLVVGVPMLAGLVLVTGLDSWRLTKRGVNRHEDHGGVRSTAPTVRPADVSPASAAGEAEAMGVEDADQRLTAVRHGGDAERRAIEAPSGVRNLAREFGLAAWAVGVFLLATYIGVLAAAGAGLLFFFSVFNRESPVFTLAVTGGVVAALYGLFTMLLGVTM